MEKIVNTLKYGTSHFVNVNALLDKPVDSEDGMMINGKFYNIFIIFLVKFIFYSVCVTSCPNGYCKPPLEWDNRQCKCICKEN